MGFELQIKVPNTGRAVGPRPVCGAVPIMPGRLAPDACLTLMEKSGRPVPLQTQVISCWQDGTVRWVLLDFVASPDPGETSLYTLRCEANGGQLTATQPIETSVEPTGEGIVRIGREVLVSLCAVDAEGRKYLALPTSFQTTAPGPVRKTVLICAEMVDSDGRRWFDSRLWVHVYAGLKKIMLEPLVIMNADKGVVQRILKLSLDLVLEGGITGASIGGSPGFEGEISGQVRLFQIDDSLYVLEPTNLRGSRAPGWAEVMYPSGRIATAVREFWQRWPKSLEVAANVLRIGLLPQFKEGTYAHLEPWYKYDYLFEGDCYRLRTGQARRWQVWIERDGDGENLAEHANAPLIPTVSPQYATSTSVWGHVAPSGAVGQERYDTWSARVFESYLEAIEDSRDYAEMNWGDWFGERKCNWANNEYDTARQLLIHFGRTSDPRAFYMAFATARHTAEVDTIHHVNEDLKSYFLDDVCRFYTNCGIIDNYPIRAGMVHAHCVGHVGGFHPVEKIHQLYCEFNPVPNGNPYLCLDPYNISHIFTQGMVYHYFLTGDPWVRETLDRIGDNLAKLVEDSRFPFAGRACEAREYGWPMLALCAIYEMDWQTRYLDAVRRLVDQVLTLQDPVHGGWLRRSGYGSCDCPGAKHEGEATFLNAIRINALCRYYELTGDARVLDPIKRDIDHLIEDRWDEDKRAWRHTACPNTEFHSILGVITMAIANSVRLFGDPKHKRVLEKIMANLLEHNTLGKSYGPIVYGTAEAAFVLARSH
ncbi:MAG: RIFT barrel domain-containing protein [Armatimonadota bacterium]